MDEEIADGDDDGTDPEDPFFPDGLDPFGLESLGADWAGYELEDELDGLYYFDDDDVFDMEDLDAEMLHYEAGEEEEDDDSLDDNDEVVFMGEGLVGAYIGDWLGGEGDDNSLGGHDELVADMGITADSEEEEVDDEDDSDAEAPVANLGGGGMPM